MKDVDDTPVDKSESETPPMLTLVELFDRVFELEKEVALLLEQRVTVRAPEANDDPEWYA